MLRMIDDAVRAANPRVTPRVAALLAALLAAIHGAMGRRALQAALGLSDQVSFRARKLKPALEGALPSRAAPGVTLSVSSQPRRRGSMRRTSLPMAACAS